MGMFDSIHTGKYCGQVKALGSTLANYSPGDHVELDPYDKDFFGHAPPDNLLSFQIINDTFGGVIVVIENTLIEWRITLLKDLPLVDYHGNPIKNKKELDQQPFKDLSQAIEYAQSCKICKRLRSHRK